MSPEPRVIVDEDIRNADFPELHGHFEALDLNDWTDCSDEGRRLLALILDIEIEHGSALSELLAAVAAEASATSLRSLAKILGVSGEALECYVQEVQEAEYDRSLIGLGWDGFRVLVENHKPFRGLPSEGEPRT